MAKKLTIEEFDPFRVRPLPNQPRKRFRGIAELAASIAEVGQATPGIVTPYKNGDGHNQYDAQLVDGERRLRACQKLKCPFRAEVRDPADAETTFVASFAANFGKQDHDCLEIAQGLQRMLGAGRNIKQIAAIAGKSEPWVYTHLALNTLHPKVKEMLVADEDADRDDAPLTLQLASLLVPLPQDRQLALATKITAGDGLSLLEARRLILKERRKSGEDLTRGVRRGRNPIDLRTLPTAVAGIRARLGVFLDLPRTQFSQLPALADGKLCAKLIEEIESAEEDLRSVRQSVEQQLVARRSPRPGNGRLSGIN